MIRNAFLIGIFTLVTATAFAQNSRSAVSVNGSDANLCTTVSPCRSFGVALAHTNAGGEVIAIDSGGYGAFTVSQSVGVIGAPGAHAAITVTSGDGIDVTAGASDTVTIRGLNITLTGGATFGINASTFGALFIDHCSVLGGVNGIRIAGGAGSHASLVDTAARAATDTGYSIASRAALVRCRAEKNADVGLSVSDGTATDGIVSAVDFVSVGNGGTGAGIFSVTAGRHNVLNLDHALVSNNVGDGISANALMSGNAAVRVTNSTVADNGQYGFNQSGSSTFRSMNNNLVAGNAAGDTLGMITAVTVH
jgi:hypothetical protein